MDAANRDSATYDAPRYCPAVVIASLTVWVVLCMASTAAAFEGERVQYAMGAGNVATAEFDEQPTQGHMLVAISAHRVSWNEAHIDSDGWEQVVLHVDEAGDTSFRRGVAIWYRVAQSDEPTTVETWWTEDGSDSSSSRDNVLLLQEFSGNYSFDTSGTNSSGDSEVTQMSTGETEDESSTSGDHSLIVSAVGARYDSEDASWDNGFQENLRAMNTEVATDSDGNSVTLQSAYRTSSNTQTWESTATWDGDSGTAGAGIAVFSQVDWNFDPWCADEISSDLSSGSTAASLMLDTSTSMKIYGTEDCCCSSFDGSGACSDNPDYRCEQIDEDMGYTSGFCGLCCGDTLWEVASNAIVSAVESEEDEISFGLGQFAVDAEIIHEVSETSSQDVIDTLENDDLSPSGWTATDEGLEVLRDELERIDGTGTIGGGILITDGHPGTSQSDTETEVDAIEEACATAEDGYSQYVVGLGGGTDQDYNNLLAAAAGTGCCGEDAEQGCPHGIDFDPCDDYEQALQEDYSVCHGSFHAANEDEFREALLSISNELSCTFPVSTEGWEDGATNPATVKVEYEGSSSGEIPHVSQSSGGVGCGEGDFCHRGYCRNPSDAFACDTDDDCASNEFCHEKLGCENEDDHCDFGCGGDEFCWYDKCVSDSEACPGGHSDCGTGEACHDGRCRDTDGDIDGDSANWWCPYDEAQAGTWNCVDDGDTSGWCHKYVGCVDAAQCTDDSDCDESNEFCWEGGCLDELDDQCEVEGGWYFPSGGDGSEVVLTDGWCAEIQDESNYDTLTTVRACTNDCVGDPGQSEGDYCPIGNPNAPGCPAGNLICDGGILDCKPSSDGANTFPPPSDEDCPYACPDGDNVSADLEGERCDLGCELSWTTGSDPVIINICDGGTDPVDQPYQRCEAGEGMFVCTDFAEAECQIDPDTFRPMPELCDGLDNSCDGQVDNIAESWDDFRNCNGTWDSANWDDARWGPNPCGSGLEIPENDEDVNEGAACFEQNQDCSCPNREDSIHQGTGATYQDEFDEYLGGWTSRDGCHCRAQ